MHFVGSQRPDDPARFFALADLFVFPTRHDLFGAVVSEAMAASTTVFSSVHAAAPRDLTEDGVAGFAIALRNAAASRAAIERTLGMRALGRERMIAKARSVVLTSTCEAAEGLIIAAPQNAREPPASVPQEACPEGTA